MVGYRRFTLTILLTLALSLGNFAFALPTTGSSTLEGRVFQSDLKTPAPDLGVQVIPSGSEKVAATGSTDSRGHFEIANVPAGEILLVLVDGTGRAVGASRIDTRAAPSRALTLALPDPEARLAPAKTEDDGEASKSGFWRCSWSEQGPRPWSTAPSTTRRP